MDYGVRAGPVASHQWLDGPREPVHAIATILGGMLTPMLGSGLLTLITFAVIVAFILFGSMSLRRHVRRINSATPWESELTPEGRSAIAREEEMLANPRKPHSILDENMEQDVFGTPDRPGRTR